MEKYSERMLLFLALAHVAAGLLLTLLPLVPSLHERLAATIFGEGRVTREVLFLVAVFGPTVASWGVLLFALVKAFFRNPSIATWRALVVSVLVWAVLDSSLCAYYGLYFAVALNVLIAGALLAMLFAARSLARAGGSAPAA